MAIVPPYQGRITIRPYLCCTLQNAPLGVPYEAAEQRRDVEDNLTHNYAIDPCPELKKTI